MTDYDKKLLRDILIDEDLTRQMADSFINKNIEDLEARPEEDQDYVEFYKFVLNMQTEFGISYIVNNCESPIEKIFISSFFMGFIKADPIGITFVPDNGDTLKMLTEFPEYIRALKNDFISFQDKTGKGYKEYFEYLKKAVDDGEVDGIILYHFFYYDTFDGENAIHLTLQPKFPNLNVKGKTIRTDMLLWKPNNESFKLIIECDGYEYHSDKKMFISDRIRDRILNNAGFQVRRYSGTEICEDPIRLSNELFEYIQKF